MTLNRRSYWLAGKSKTLGRAAINMAALCGVDLDDQQQYFLLGAMEIYAHNGRWVNPTVQDVQPRQNGKNEIIQAREVYGAWRLGETILHTAHQLATSKDAFKRAQRFVQSTPSMYAEVDQIYRGNGEWSIIFHSGGSINYRARTNNAGLGLTNISLVVLDEGQEITREEMSASLPTLATAEFSQAWFAGTGGKKHSEVWWDTRIEHIIAEHEGREIKGTFRVEHSAETWEVVKNPKSETGYNVIFNPVDPSDEKLWYKVNTGLREGRILLSYFREQIGPLRLGPKLFAREHLGVWEPLDEKLKASTVQTKLTPSQFNLRKRSDSATTKQLVFAIATTADESSTTISVASPNRNYSNALHVETVAKDHGVLWVEDWLAEKLKTHKPKKLVYSTSGPSRILSSTFTRLLDSPKIHTDLVKVSKVDFSIATSYFIHAIQEGLIFHLGDKHISRALDQARIVQSSKVNDQTVWDLFADVDDYDIAALESATLATFVASKMRVRSSGNTALSFA